MRSLAWKERFPNKLPFIAMGVLLAAAVLWWGVRAPWSPVATKQPAKHGGHGEPGADKHDPSVVHLSPEKHQAAGLKLAVVEKGTITSEHWLTGQVNLNESRLAHISSRVTGTVREVHAQL